MLARNIVFTCAGADDAADALPSLLIVDDSARQRRTLTAIAEGLGWRACSAEDGERALDLCRTQTFAAVLLDFNMPGADGLEITRRLRAMGGWCAHVPIVLISAAASPVLEAQARRAGANACLAKPVRPEQIAEVLGGAPARALKG